MKTAVCIETINDLRDLLNDLNPQRENLVILFTAKKPFHNKGIIWWKFDDREESVQVELISLLGLTDETW